MSGNDELGDMIAELTKLREEHEALKAKVREYLTVDRWLTSATTYRQREDLQWEKYLLLTQLRELVK